MLPKLFNVTLRLRMRGASSYNIRTEINIKVCCDSLSQTSRNIENRKLEIRRISRPKRFPTPHAAWVLAIARRLGSGLTIILVVIPMLRFDEFLVGVN
jgi:hypothetical protein